MELLSKIWRAMGRLLWGAASAVARRHDGVVAEESVPPPAPSCAPPRAAPPPAPVDQVSLGLMPPKAAGDRPGEFPPTRFPYDPGDVSLAFAQEWLGERLKVGEACPCCTQLSKVYARTITSTMAYALICIYRAGDDWLHVPDYLSRVCQVGPTVRGGDWAKLTAWGLLQEHEGGVREDGSSRTGYYRITAAGKAFVKGETTLPRYALFYDGRVLRLAGDKQITINSALGKRFDYRELMAAAPSGL